MKARILVAVAVVAAVGVTASAAGGSTARSQASITVWLQNDAQNGWPELVASVNSQFQKDHPGVDVNVQYQTWPTHLQKFDATLAGGNAPDVVEMGTTEMTKYMAAGAFQDLTCQQVVLRELGELAQGPEGLRHVRRPPVRRSVLRRRACRHVSHRPVQEGGRQQAAHEPGRVHRPGEEARREEPGQGLLAPVHRRPGLVRGPGLRLRLRRTDRQGLPWQVARPRSTRRRRSPA